MKKRHNSIVFRTFLLLLVGFYGSCVLNAEEVKINDKIIVIDKINKDIISDISARIRFSGYITNFKNSPAIVFTLTPLAEEAGRKAVIGYIKGDVKITKIKQGIPMVAKLGMSLVVGDKIVTGADSKTELKFEDGTTFRIGDNSSVVIEEMERQAGVDKSTMKVMFGRIWMNIKTLTENKPRESILVTPKVVATIKGTTYRADVGRDGEATVNVYDGVVACTIDGQKAEVNKFEKISSKGMLKEIFNETEDAKDEWVKWNKNRDKIRVMVVFTERKNGLLSVVPLSEVIFAEELLKNYLYSVIDQATLNLIRDNDKLKAALTDDKDGRKAAVAGLELGADISITGQVDASAMKTDVLNGMFTGISDIAIKVVRCDTAEIVASKNTSGRMADLMEQGAFNNAVRMTSAKLVKIINDDIVRAWEKETAKGASINISFYNVTFEKASEIRNALAGISGAKNVNQIFFTAGRALFAVTFAGDSLSLAERIAELNVGSAKLSVVGVSMNRVEVEVK